MCWRQSVTYSKRPPSHKLLSDSKGNPFAAVKSGRVRCDRQPTMKTQISRRCLTTARSLRA
eukprot:752780-Hanusia_phi.AAC.1